MEFLRRLRDAASTVDPAAREMDEGNRLPVPRRDRLTALFRRIDLDHDRCVAIEIPSAAAARPAVSRIGLPR
jgi:hypothetical protein